MSCGNNTSDDESQMTPHAKLEAGESLTDADRVILLELLHDGDRPEEMGVSHVQEILCGDDSEDEDDSFSFPARPDDWESGEDDDPFEFASRWRVSYNSSHTPVFRISELLNTERTFII